MFEWTFVEVLPISLFQVLSSSVPDKSKGDKEQNEGATDPPCIGYEILRILLKDNYDDHWD